MRKIARSIALAAAVVVMAACQGTATSTSPIFTTEFYSGTVVTGPGDLHTVTTSLTSTVSIGLTTLDPNTGVAIGVGIGTVPLNNQPGCTIAVFQTVHVGESFSINGVAPGTYCLAVFEYFPGTVPDPLTYTVKFSHH